MSWALGFNFFSKKERVVSSLLRKVLGESRITLSSYIEMNFCILFYVHKIYKWIN